MALPTLDATFASAADLPRRQMLAKWLVNLQYSGSIEDYWTLPEHYLWAKIAVAAGAPRSESDYISLPKNYVWSDLYNAVSGSSGQTIDRGEKEAIGWIAAAVRGDAGDPAKVATYINWPWRYQVASIITALAVDADAQSFITTSGATDVEAIDQFVKGVKNLGLWDSMICWPLRSSQNAGTGTTAYSLGGLGTYSGTLVNGPAWALDGVVFAAANNTHINTNYYTPQTTEFSAGGVIKQSTTGNLMTVVANDNVFPDRRWNRFTGTGSSEVFDPSFRSIIINEDNTNWKMSSMLYSTTNPVQLVVNTTNAQSIETLGYTFPANAVHPITLGARWRPSNNTFSAKFDGTQAFAFFITQRIVLSSFYDLYKSTLGQDLSLP